MNTPVYSSYYGKVTYAGWMRGYGKIIIIKHPRGYFTRYAHLNKIFVKKGENISEGKLIGKSGSTGISTGPHLHYEIRCNEKPLDPLKYKK
jgi:murein DD-endopeptidase MepM/ murein hydrolase activator NlpD